ncbi:MAG TPA: hypothetical protein PKZ08_14885 [Vicinamibacterales bacterium]|jgi:hypothetical protein|nr:hypothetical protein [Vicinamibacterales bacterium]
MSEEKETKAALEDAIVKSASGPKSAQVDGQRVEQHPLSDLVQADRYLASKRAARGRYGGLRIMRMSHSGAL